MLTCAGSVTNTHTLTPPSLPMHWQTLHFTLILPLYHPHRDKSSLPQHVKPSLIWTVSLPSRVLFLIFSSPGWQQTYRTTRLQLWLYIGVSHAHTHTETPDRNHNILLFFLFFSPFGNCRVNIFINHITWHDAPKFYSAYRNTLNKTQGFTMDTRLTFCPLHLQQWMTFFQIFSFLFFPLLPFVTSRITLTKLKTSW